MIIIKIKLAGQLFESLVNGDGGLRRVLFTQGCPHMPKCCGCHNPSTWNLEDGTAFNTEDLIADIKNNPLLSGITLSGGEPFMQAQAISEILSDSKKLGLNTWVYSGYTYEELLGMLKVQGVLSSLLNIDVLVDGKFCIDLQDTNLKYRGSSNQRLIDVQKSISEDKIILYEVI